MVTVAQLLQEHVSLDIECVDRLYLNGYVPSLQTPQGLVALLRHHLGKPVPSPVLLGRLTSSFCNEVELFIAEKDIPLVQFEKRQRKDDVANAIRAERKTRDGVVFVGVAQEKASAFKGRKVGPCEFDYTRADVFVKHYYFYTQLGSLFKLSTLNSQRSTSNKLQLASLKLSVESWTLSVERS